MRHDPRRPQSRLQGPSGTYHRDPIPARPNRCERLVIAIIGQHENLETGQCDPGVETIARESGLHDRAVYRAIAGAERKGALVITRTGSGGRNGRNSYRLCGGNPDKSSGLNPDKETLTKRSKNPDKVSPELTELPPRRSLGSSSERGESDGLWPMILLPRTRGPLTAPRRRKISKAFPLPPRRFSLRPGASPTAERIIRCAASRLGAALGGRGR